MATKWKIEKNFLDEIKLVVDEDHQDMLDKFEMGNATEDDLNRLIFLYEIETDEVILISKSGDETDNPPPQGEKETKLMKTYTDVIEAVHKELKRAQQKHSPMNSNHEAYAVIMEEVCEYWDSVMSDDPDPKELVQIAAMAIRALLDLHLSNNPTPTGEKEK